MIFLRATLWQFRLPELIAFDFTLIPSFGVCYCLAIAFVIIILADLNGHFWYSFYFVNWLVSHVRRITGMCERQTCRCIVVLVYNQINRIKSIRGIWNVCGTEFFAAERKKKSVIESLELCWRATKTRNVNVSNWNSIVYMAFAPKWFFSVFAFWIRTWPRPDIQVTIWRSANCTPILIRIDEPPKSNSMQKPRQIESNRIDFNTNGPGINCLNRPNQETCVRACAHNSFLILSTQKMSNLFKSPKYGQCS